MAAISAENFQNVCFWGEIARSDHLLHVYDDDAPFMDALSGFIAGGLLAGDAVIAIATPEHLNAVDTRLAEYSIDARAVRAGDQYIALDAEETLKQFMRDGWPNEVLFKEVISGLLKRATANGRKVRAFGEMVVVLWANGLHEATIRLEHLWQGLCHTEHFSLLCAYPKTSFTRGLETSLGDICSAHSRTVA